MCIHKSVRLIFKKIYNILKIAFNKQIILYSILYIKIMSLLYQAPVITRSSALDNQSEDDHELLTITSLASSSVYPTYVKIISDNITTNSLSQKNYFH